MNRDLERRVQALEADVTPGDIDRAFFTELAEREHAAAEKLDALIEAHATDEQVATISGILKAWTRTQDPNADYDEVDDDDEEDDVQGSAVPAPNALKEWIHVLSWGNSTLPETLTGETFRHLLNYVLKPERDFFVFAICDTCGVIRPREDRGYHPGVIAWLQGKVPRPEPDHGPPCSHCGGLPWTSTTRLDEQPHEWRVDRFKCLNERYGELSPATQKHM
jgi:hypothetical protein